MNRYVELASHCIGLDRHKPYRRHGKKYYRPYRNFFACAWPDDDWELMVAAGRAWRRDGICNVIYGLTRDGLDWLGRELNMTIYDMED